MSLTSVQESESVSADITQPIAQVCGIVEKPFYGVLIKKKLNYACRVDQYIRVISGESFIMCLFTCLL